MINKIIKFLVGLPSKLPSLLFVGGVGLGGWFAYKKYAAAMLWLASWGNPLQNVKDYLKDHIPAVPETTQSFTTLKKGVNTQKDKLLKKVVDSQESLDDLLEEVKNDKKSNFQTFLDLLPTIIIIGALIIFALWLLDLFQAIKDFFNWLLSPLSFLKQKKIVTVEVPALPILQPKKNQSRQDNSHDDRLSDNRDAQEEDPLLKSLRLGKEAAEDEKDKILNQLNTFANRSRGNTVKKEIIELPEIRVVVGRWGEYKGMHYPVDVRTEVVKPHKVELNHLYSVDVKVRTNFNDKVLPDLKEVLKKKKNERAQKLRFRHARAAMERSAPRLQRMAQQREERVLAEKKAQEKRQNARFHREFNERDPNPNEDPGDQADDDDPQKNNDETPPAELEEKVSSKIAWNDIFSSSGHGVAQLLVDNPEILKKVKDAVAPVLRETAKFTITTWSGIAKNFFQQPWSSASSASNAFTYDKAWKVTASAHEAAVKAFQETLVKSGDAVKEGTSVVVNAGSAAEFIPVLAKKTIKTMAYEALGSWGIGMLCDGAVAAYDAYNSTEYKKEGEEAEGRGGNSRGKELSFTEKLWKKANLKDIGGCSGKNLVGTVAAGTVGVLCAPMLATGGFLTAVGVGLGSAITSFSAKKATGWLTGWWN